MHASYLRCPHEKNLNQRIGFTEPSWDYQSQKGPKNNLRLPYEYGLMEMNSLTLVLSWLVPLPIPIPFRRN